PRRLLRSSQSRRLDSKKRSEKAAPVRVNRSAVLAAAKLYLRRPPLCSARRRLPLATHRSPPQGAETLPPKARPRRSVFGPSDCDPVPQEQPDRLLRQRAHRDANREATSAPAIQYLPQADTAPSACG